ncbi:hypothetical protein ACC720_32365 [Rhizobium ruizarguesonis]
MNTRNTIKETKGARLARRRMPDDPSVPIDPAETHYGIETVIDARSNTIVGMNLRAVPAGEVSPASAPRPASMQRNGTPGLVGDKERSVPKHAFHAMPVSTAPLYEFLCEAAPEIAETPTRADEWWGLLEDACVMFVAMRKEGVSIGGRLPSLGRTALRDILPALGALVGADKAGFDLASVPKSFVSLVTAYEDAVRRAEARKALERRASDLPGKTSSQDQMSPHGDVSTGNRLPTPRNQFLQEK